MAAFFSVCGWSYKNSERKTQEGDKLYRLWFVVDSSESVYSDFRRCQGGGD